MLEIVANVTRRGQVTIPVAVRRHLGIDAPGKVMFVLGEDGTVILQAVTRTAASLVGSLRLPSGEAPGDFKAVIEDAMMEEMAEREVAKLRRQGGSLP